MPSSDRLHDRAALSERLRKLGLHGAATSLGGLDDLGSLHQLLEVEEADRKRRSYERRLRFARIGPFKSMSDFDWAWPTKADRVAIDELLSLRFLEEGRNVVIAGPNGLGKTMILRNLAHNAILQGHTVRAVSASEMLADLAAQETRLRLPAEAAPVLRPQTPLRRRGGLPVLR